MQTKTSRSALKWITGALFLTVISCSVANNVIAVTMNPMVEEFALTGAAQGLMSSMINLGSILPILIIPFLQGRVHKAVMVLAGSLLQMLMLIVTGISGSFPLLLSACVLLGVGNNFTDSCCNSYIVDLHPRDNSKYLNLLHGFFGVGGLITPLLITWVVNRSGWRVSYTVAALVCAAVCAAYALIVLRNTRRTGSVSAAADKPITAAMLRGYICNRRNLLLMVGTIFYAASQIGLINWVVRYMSVRFGDADMGSLCISAYWICATVCRMTCSRLPFPPHKLLVAGAAGAGLFHAVGVLSGSPVVMLVCSGLVGLVSGLCIPVIVSEGALGNEDRTALSTSALFGLMAVSRMIMPLIMGSAAADSIVLSMLLPAAAALIGAGFCALANRYRPA